MCDFFHPYIDPEPSQDILSQVDQLVDAEMEVCEHPLETSNEAIDEPHYINFEPPKYTTTANYQNLLHRESLSQYILKNQSLLYHNQLNSLDDQARYLQLLESKIKDEIDMVLQGRYDEQMQAAPLLRNLQSVNMRTLEGISRAESILGNIS